MAFIEKVIQLVKEPLNLMLDYAKEPLRSRAHERAQEECAAAHNRAKDLSESRIKAETDAAIRTKEHETMLPARLARAQAEVEHYAKQLETERLEHVSKSMLAFAGALQELTRNANHAVAGMRIELTARGDAMLAERLTYHVKLIEEAGERASSEFAAIEKRFPNNLTARRVLEAAAERKLAIVMDTCERFMRELTDQGKRINDNIEALTLQSHELVERQLGRFEVIAPGARAVIQEPLRNTALVAPVDSVTAESVNRPLAGDPSGAA